MSCEQWSSFPYGRLPLTYRPTGGRLISLNQTSLEGMTFSEAAEVMQNSPQEVQLIASQPKGTLL